MYCLHCNNSKHLHGIAYSKLQSLSTQFRSIECPRYILYETPHAEASNSLNLALLIDHVIGCRQTQFYDTEPTKHIHCAHCDIASVVYYCTAVCTIVDFSTALEYCIHISELPIP